MSFVKGHTLSRGSRRRKLSATAAQEIYRSHAQSGDLAAEYGVSVACISRIRRGYAKQRATGAKEQPPKYLRGVRLGLHEATKLDNAIKALEAAGILRPDPRP
jgi:hypothetical protein